MSPTTATHPADEATIPLQGTGSPRVLEGLVAARLDRRSTGVDGATCHASDEPSYPTLSNGKTTPAPAEWRALARRASSFRLR